MTAFFAGTVDARAGGGDAGIALRGLDRALAAGRLSPLDAHEHRQRVRLAQRVLRRLPAKRRHSLAMVLDEVADQASTYDGPRALTLFTTLELNAKHLVHDRLPAPGHDVADGLGVVYRSVPGRGLRFHPLGSFGQLNKYVSAGQRAVGNVARLRAARPRTRRPARADVGVRLPRRRRGPAVDVRDGAGRRGAGARPCGPRARGSARVRGDPGAARERARDRRRGSASTASATSPS